MAASSSSVDVPLDTHKLLGADRVGADETPIIIASCGSYNPIHTGHVAMFDMAKAALESGASVPAGLAGQKIRVVGGFLSPVNDAYGKAGLAPFPPRLQLCNAALEKHEWLSADAWEGTQPAFVRSYYVLKHILDQVKAHYTAAGHEDIAGRVQIAFLCGADLFESFYRPGCWQLDLLKRIFSEMLLVAVCREGSHDPRERMRDAEPLTHKDSPGVTLDMKQFDGRVAVLGVAEGKCASSTLVRRLLSEGKSVEGLVPDECLPLLQQDNGPYPFAVAKGDSAE